MSSSLSRSFANILTQASRSLIILSAIALSGCSGGDPDTLGPDKSGTPTPSSDAPLLFSDATSEADSKIGGNLIVSKSNTIRGISATLRHETRALKDYTDGVVKLTDSDGDESGVWTDGTTSIAPNQAQRGTYDYAAILNQTSAMGSGPLIAGVLTPQKYMPTSKSESYTGEAFIVGSNVNSGGFSTSGTSMVAADFESGMVSLTLNGFNLSNFDRLEINDMKIRSAEAGFSGGVLKLYAKDVDVTTAILGSGQTNSNEGRFFGLDATKSAPDEVGGVFVGDGSDGTISGGFLSD